MGWINMNADIKIKNELVGLTLNEFKNQKYDNYRVVKVNDEAMLVTRDMDYERINLELYNEIITNAYYG